jgi:hypothetical protein
LPEGGDLEAPAELSFDGPVDRLKGTVFVPTLERPIPAGKSAIWCATMPMAWQELEKTVIKGPLDVKGAEEICRELRASPGPNLEAKDYYVAAGFANDGISERIRRELPARFPKAPLDAVPPVHPDGAIALAYLEVSLFYDYFFKHNEEPLHFKDADGRQTPVHAFGIREKDGELMEQSFRGQVLVLFRDKGEFAVDLSHNTKPYQIVLARMARKASLKETLAALDTRIGDAEPKHLDSGAIMLVPSMNWKIEHRFRELEKRPVEAVYQSIQFKMDRKGAYVASVVTVTLPNGHPEADPNPNHYLFDRPFLIVMKKRGVRQPFFVMWVDSAELLQKH